MSEVTNSRHSGTWYSMGLWGELTEGQTLTCCHCQTGWMLVKGSGKSRGFCQNCMGYTCGARGCEVQCVSASQAIENMEAGRPADYKPARVWVPPGIDDVRG